MMIYEYILSIFTLRREYVLLSFNFICLFFVSCPVCEHIFNEVCFDLFCIFVFTVKHFAIKLHV